MTNPSAPTISSTGIRSAIELIAGIAILLCAIYFFRTWLGEHDARLKAEANVAAAQKSIDAAAAQVKQLQDAEKARDARTAASIDKIAEAASARKTPQQIVKWIPSQLGALPAPIKSSIPAATPRNPSPAATFAVPEADLDPLRDLISQGRQCAIKLPSVEADVISCQAQVKAVRAQLAEAEKQRDDYNLELKGGTFWRRVKHDLKVAGIAAGAGALAVCAAGHCK